MSKTVSMKANIVLNIWVTILEKLMQISVLQQHFIL